MNLGSHPIVYHGIPCPPVGDFLLPSEKYGSELTQEVRTALGLAPNMKPPLLFASTHISKALAFTFSRQNKEVLFNAPIKHTDYELIVLLDRSRTMSSPRNGAVYAYSSEGYVPLSNLSRQLVSMSPVRISETSKILEITNSLDAMKEGLQIFTMHETFDQIDIKSFFREREERELSPIEIIKELLNDGRAEWENYTHDIKPLKILAEILDYNSKG